MIVSTKGKWTTVVVKVERSKNLSTLKVTTEFTINDTADDL